MEFDVVGPYQHINVEAGELPSEGEPLATSPPPTALDQTEFLRQMLRELTGTLERVVGEDLAEGYISVVGTALGQWLNTLFQQEFASEPDKVKCIANVLVELKARIRGGFYIKSIDSEKIVFGNTACPFGSASVGRPSMCAITTQVFGTVAATNLEYARVDLAKTIARGHKECLVTLYLNPPADDQPAQGVEFFRDPHAIDL